MTSPLRGVQHLVLVPSSSSASVACPTTCADAVVLPGTVFRRVWRPDWPSLDAWCMPGDICCLPSPQRTMVFTWHTTVHYMGSPAHRTAFLPPAGLTCRIYRLYDTRPRSTTPSILPFYLPFATFAGTVTTRTCYCIMPGCGKKTPKPISFRSTTARHHKHYSYMGGFCLPVMLTVTDILSYFCQRLVRTAVTNTTAVYLFLRIAQQAELKLRLGGTAFCTRVSNMVVA